MSPDELMLTHSIVGTEHGTQGAGQIVPEDVVLCVKCGWMRCSDYVLHLSDELAEHDRHVRAEVLRKAADLIENSRDAQRCQVNRSCHRADILLLRQRAEGER